MVAPGANNAELPALFGSALGPVSRHFIFSIFIYTKYNLLALALAGLALPGRAQAPNADPWTVVNTTNVFRPAQYQNNEHAGRIAHGVLGIDRRCSAH